MKIVGNHSQISQQVRGVFHVQCNKMGDWALMFERAVYDHEPRCDQCAAFFLCKVTPHDYVRVSSFVFQRDEGDAAGSSGTLTAGYEASNAYVAS